MARSSFVASPAKIKVIGLGGGGSNAVTRMVRENIQGVEFIAMNTDAQALAVCEAPMCIQLGPKLTKGLGAGGDHHVGHKAAEETRDELIEVVSGSDMVFVTAGMGGGTGTGSISVVAEIAKRSGALTIGVVTKPFAFEGAHRMQNAEEGIEELIDKVDTLIIIPNDRLLTLCDHKTGVDSAFKVADDVLRHGVQAIAEVITTPGMINLDFADVKAIMKDAGPAWMSIGKGSGQNRAIDAAKEALASPLLDVSIEGSKAVLFNVLGSSNLTLFEVNQAAEVIRGAVDPEANIIFGVANDAATENEITITLIATGFHAKLGMGKNNEEDEQLTNILKNMKTEEELDMPSFLRRPLFSHRRTVPQQQQQPSGFREEPVKTQRHFQ
jgi:cell division protein FtsZ